MSRQLDLPEDVFNALTRAASDVKMTPVEWLIKELVDFANETGQRLPEEFWKFAGKDPV